MDLSCGGVSSKHCKKGLGRKLMEAIHALGIKENCNMATVATMSFQNARMFYEHLGYVCDFERSGYTQNGRCIFLKKLLCANV